MPDKKRAQKISHLAEKHIIDPSESFEHAINGRLGDKRLVNRILNGRKVKPCGRECRDFGLLIVHTFNHGSFENMHELMDDEEFILEAAKMSKNPRECDNYFYQYISNFLTRKSEFRLNFLKQVYLNENVYKLDDINWVVENCGLQKENKIILNDMQFKKLIEKRLNEVDYQNMVHYNCSGDDEKELHEYKVKANEMKVLCENIKIGLTEIYNSFAGKKIEKEEPQTYWEYLCAQAKAQET